MKTISAVFLLYLLPACNDHYSSEQKKMKQDRRERQARLIELDKKADSLKKRIDSLEKEIAPLQNMFEAGDSISPGK